MNELLHHIFLFLEFLCGIYDDKKYSLEESICNQVPLRTQIIVYITIFIVSNRHLPNTKQEYPFRRSRWGSSMYHIHALLLPNQQSTNLALQKIQ